MNRIIEEIAAEHIRENGAAGDGITAPREWWTACSCGANIAHWQQFYEETGDDLDERWVQHIAYVTEQAVRARIVADVQRRKRDLVEGYVDVARAMLEMGMDEAARVAEGSADR